MKTADRGGPAQNGGICLIFISSKMIFLAVIAGEISIQTIVPVFLKGNQPLHESY